MNTQDWFPLGWTGWIAFAVQGTLKSLLQCHSSKTSILQHSAFFIVHLSHPYMTTGKTVALTRWTFVGKVMSLLFNMLSRLVIIFFPMSKHLLIPWLQSPSAVILEPPKIKSVTVFTVSPGLINNKHIIWPEAVTKQQKSVFLQAACITPVFTISFQDGTCGGWNYVREKEVDLWLIL